MKKIILMLLALISFSDSYSQQNDSTFVKFMAKNFIVSNSLKNKCEGSLICVKLKVDDNNKLKYSLIGDYNDEINRSLKFIENFKLLDSISDLNNTLFFILVENDKDDCIKINKSPIIIGKEILDLLLIEQRLNSKVKILPPIIAKVNSTYR